MPSSSRVSRSAWQRVPARCRTASVRATVGRATGDRRGSARPAGGVAAPTAAAPRLGRTVWLSVVLDCKWFWLACAEGDDAPDRVVRRDADGDAVTRDDLDAEAAHPAAELGEHLVSGVALHTVKPAAVNRHDGALHVDEIVLAQTPAILSVSQTSVPQTLCHMASAESEVAH